jgi:hypothetical protein
MKLFFYFIFQALLFSQTQTDLFSVQRFYNTDESALRASNLTSENNLANTLTNPAQRIILNQAYFSFSPAYLETSFVATAFSFHIDSIKFVAGMNALLSNNFEERSSDGSLIGTYNNSELMPFISTQFLSQSDFLMGANLKYVISSLAGHQAQAIMADLSILYFINDSKRSRISFHIRDLGLIIKQYQNASESIFARTELGLSQYLKNNPIKFYLALPLTSNFKSSERLLWRLGVEYKREDSPLALYFGYSSEINSNLQRTNANSVFNGLSTGLKIKTNWLALSLAYKNDGILDSYLSFAFQKDF